MEGLVDIEVLVVTECSMDILGLVLSENGRLMRNSKHSRLSGHAYTHAHKKVHAHTLHTLLSVHLC